MAMSGWVGLYSGDCGFSEFYDSIEPLRVRYGNLAEHLAIKLDIGLLAAVDKLAVSYVTLTAGCTKPRNPQPSEVPLASLSVDSRPHRRPDTGFLG
jgi:hypothetical protein